MYKDDWIKILNSQLCTSKILTVNQLLHKNQIDCNKIVVLGSMYNEAVVHAQRQSETQKGDSDFHSGSKPGLRGTATPDPC